MTDIPLTGEVSNSKLAAVFDSEATARAAILVLADQTTLKDAQVKVVKPGERHPNIKLEPEGGGIWRTIVVAHVWLGVAGIVLGAAAFGILMWSGVPAIVNSPWLAGLLLVVFGGIGGLMLGGLVALRPDHDRFILATHDASAKGKTTIVVHALDARQAEQAAGLLEEMGGEVTRTL